MRNTLEVYTVSRTQNMVTYCVFSWSTYFVENIEKLFVGSRRCESPQWGHGVNILLVVDAPAFPGHLAWWGFGDDVVIRYSIGDLLVMFWRCVGDLGCVWHWTNAGLRFYDADLSTDRLGTDRSIRDRPTDRLGTDRPICICFFSNK